MSNTDALDYNLDYDTVMIGAGAAGLLCASMVGKRGKSVALIEHGDKVGAKILISGGGRCNFTNIDAKAQNYSSANPHFMKSALKRYTPWDFIALMAEHNLTYHEKKLGQLFCDQKSKAVVQMLEAECEKSNVEIFLQTTLKQIQQNEDESYHLSLNNKRTIQCANLVIASGGLSIPKMGATPFAYQLAQQFNIPVVDPSPALVPFTFSSEMGEFMKSLAGVAIDSEISCNGVSFRENLLFTHRGLSGPAILQISSFWNAGDAIEINLLPSIDIFNSLISLKKSTPKSTLYHWLKSHWPERLARSFTERYLPPQALTELSTAQIEQVARTLKSWSIKPVGTEGYRTAEVTKGGISTHALSSKTMECNDYQGLYFIGECVDVTGWLGGYNFQWAWSSAYAAAEAIIQK